MRFRQASQVPYLRGISGKTEAHRAARALTTEVYTGLSLRAADEWQVRPLWAAWPSKVDTEAVVSQISLATLWTRGYQIAAPLPAPLMGCMDAIVRGGPRTESHSWMLLGWHSWDRLSTKEIQVNADIFLQENEALTQTHSLIPASPAFSTHLCAFVQ